MIKRINPKIVALFPSFSDANFPITKPIYVKKVLTIANISIAIILELVTADKPRPVEKASIDTPKANNKIP